ncbi:MAG: hypothetical protein HRU41_08145 [Saprospiraceae bacterium]|nr:hypothetical protein [Saprospiraceae bacterium]
MDDLLILLLKGNAHLLIFYLTYRFCFKQFTFFGLNRLYLLLSLPLAFALANYSIPIPVAVEVLPNADADLMKESVVSNLVHPIITTDEPSATNTYGWSSVWMVIYLFGVGVGVLRLCYRFRQVQRLLKNGRRTVVGRMVIVESAQVQQTASFLHLLFCADKELLLAQDYVFEHERSHYLQGHSWDRLWLELWSIINWFNPLMYFYKRDLQLLHEYLADERVVRKSKDLYGYATFLAGKGTGQSLYLVNTFSSHIKSRLIMLSKNQTDRSKSRYYLLLLPILAIMLMANSRRIASPSQADTGATAYYLDWGGFTLPFDGDRQIDTDIEIDRLRKLTTERPRLMRRKSLDVTGQGAVLVLMRNGKGWLECELSDSEAQDELAPCITQMIETAEVEDVLYIHNLSSTNRLRFSVALRLRKSSLNTDSEGQGLIEPVSTLEEIDFSSITGIDDTPMIVLEPVSGAYKASNIWTNDRIHMLLGSMESHPSKEIDMEKLRRFYQRPLSVVIGETSYPIVHLAAKVESEKINRSFNGRHLTGPQIDQLIGLLNEPTTIYFPYVLIDLKEDGKLMRIAIPDLLRYNFKIAL